ncbi:MAG: hypothetical protein ABI193_09060 [Minicystis sp.]
MNRTPRLASTLIRRCTRAALFSISLAVFALAGCGGSGSSSSGTTSTGGDDASCSASNACEKGACVFGPGTCKAGSVGVCQDFFQCDGPPTGPICGCDGKTIEGEYPGCGPTPPYDVPAACQTGTFACGAMLSCKRNSDVCIVHTPGEAGPSTYECVDHTTVNRSCLGGIPACNCLDLEKIGPGASCQEDADFQDTITVAMP